MKNYLSKIALYNSIVHRKLKWLAVQYLSIYNSNIFGLLKGKSEVLSCHSIKNLRNKQLAQCCCVVVYISVEACWHSKGKQC